MFAEIQSRPRMRILSSSLHPMLGRWPLLEDARESFRKYIATKFYLINCHSGKDWGAKLWPDMLAFIKLKKKKKETMSHIFVVKCVASP